MQQKTTENTQENNVFVGEMLLKGKGMLNIDCLPILDFLRKSLLSVSSVSNEREVHHVCGYILYKNDR